MTGPTNIERALDAFLAPETDRLPDRVVDAALAVIDRTPQRPALRVPWRYSLMPSFSRASGVIGAAVVVVIVAVGALLLIGRPATNIGAPTPSALSSQPAPSASLPPPTELPASALVPVKSAQYGYTISVPKGWGVQAATRTLHGTEPLFGSQPEAGTPAGDSIMGGLFGQDTAAAGRLLIAGGPVPASTTLESWTADTAVVKCGAPTSQAGITVDGEAASLSTFASCAGVYIQWVTVLHGGWGWHIAWINNPGSESTDIVIFRQLLGTFRFGTVLPSPS